MVRDGYAKWWRRYFTNRYLHMRFDKDLIVKKKITKYIQCNIPYKTNKYLKFQETQWIENKKELKNN